MKLPLLDAIRSVEDLDKNMHLIARHLNQEDKPLLNSIRREIKNELERELMEYYTTGSSHDFAGISADGVEKIIENVRTMAIENRRTVARRKKEKNIENAYNRRGEASLQLGEYTAALSDFSEVDVDVLTVNGEYRKNMGIAKYHLQQYEEAIAYFDEALTTFMVVNNTEATVETYYYSGLSKYKLDPHSDAISDFDAALNAADTPLEPSVDKKFLDYLIDKIKEIKKFAVERLSEEKRIELWHKEAILELHGHLCVCGDRAEKVRHKGSNSDLSKTDLSLYCALCRTCYEGMPNDFNTFTNIASTPDSEGEAYNQYLNSDSWKIKKQIVFKRDNKLCICGEPAKAVHHKTYERLRLTLSSAEQPSFIGNERLSDLVAVCESCHNKVHGRGTLVRFGY